MTGPMIIEKCKYFHDKMKTTNKCTVSAGWLQNTDTVHNLGYLIIEHLSSPVGSRLKEFYCSAKCNKKSTRQQRILKVTG
jgi:hypothetical protein